MIEPTDKLEGIPEDVRAEMRALMEQTLAVAHVAIPPEEDYARPAGGRIIGQGPWRGGWALEAAILTSGGVTFVRVQAYHDSANSRGHMSGVVEFTVEEREIHALASLELLLRQRQELDEAIARVREAAGEKGATFTLGAAA